MATILTDQGEHDVAARDGLWVGGADAERALGWTLKPEGMCRGDVCVPLLAAETRDGRVDLAAFWRRLGHPVVRAESGDVWSLGTGAATRRESLEGLAAPDFTLAGLDGAPRSLSELRGRKVFLTTWASW
ncbi:MAG: hypothetical protein IPK81_14700 [Rhodospirillales bacterium]|nr:hypothetical protein [Rhodospirillales bacterium]QQS10874.1 MAG: hypothetical protein IPK81_14700 [Rhodospirillales bacterium]